MGALCAPEHGMRACQCLREHGLLGTCLESCPEWGEPNLCVHTLKNSAPNLMGVFEESGGSE